MQDAGLARQAIGSGAVAGRRPIITARPWLGEAILAKNDRQAERGRGWVEGRNVLALSLMSSAGAGKTTLMRRGRPTRRART